MRLLGIFELLFEGARCGLKIDVVGGGPAGPPRLVALSAT